MQPRVEAKGDLRFVIGVLHPRTVTIRLGPKTSVIEGALEETPAATVFCDNAQLDALLNDGFSPRPLRTSGQRELLDYVTTLFRSGDSAIDLRAKGMS